jgi:hypothetical protein
VLAALRKQGGAPFKTPYDGRYFTVHGKEGLSARKNVGPTIRFKANGSSPIKTAQPELSVPASALVPLDRPYMCITPVWGEPYTSTFINITLPSQLAEGNLGSFAKDEVEYVIATTAHDENKIRLSDSFRRLQDIAPFHSFAIRRSTMRRTTSDRRG